MRPRWSRIAAVLSTLAVVVGATACSSSEESDELLIYNAQHESLTKEWIDAFTKETGIKVTYRRGGDTELGNQLVAEGAASPADVFLTENSPAMAAVERADLFADLEPDTINQVPAQYRPASGKWTGVAARTTVFVYNKTRLQPDQLPKSLLDLEQPAWKGRWGAPPTKADFQAIVAALLQLKGEQATAQWLAGMKVNAKIYNDNIATLKAVNAGEVDGGVIYHYYWFRDQAKTKEMSANTALHYFKNEDPGAFVSAAPLMEPPRWIRRSSSCCSLPARPAKRCWRRAHRSSIRSPATCRRTPPCRRSTRCRHRRWTPRPWTPKRCRT